MIVMQRIGTKGLGIVKKYAKREGVYVSVEAAERVVAALVKVPLNQHQFDALVSCVVTIGGIAFGRSHLLQRLNVGHYAGAHRQLRNWGALGLRDGLCQRRQAEAQLFEKPV